MQLNRVVPCFSASFSSSWCTKKEIPIQIIVKYSLFLRKLPLTNQQMVYSYFIRLLALRKRINPVYLNAGLGCFVCVPFVQSAILSLIELDK